MLADNPEQSGEKCSIRQMGEFAEPTTAAEIEQAKSDPNAFGRLYEAHYSAILNYVYRRTLNVSVAEDLTSNTFFKALRALPKYRPRAPFRAWLYRIATNEIRMLGRSERRFRATVQNPTREENLDRLRFTQPEVFDKMEQEERLRQYAQLHQLLAQLPEKYQTVLTLRYLEGLAPSEVAAVVGKRIGTVKSLINRGLKRLRKVMEKKNATLR